MPKSSSGIPGRSGTVTVIEEPVLRSYARKARIVFFLTLASVGLLAAAILVGKWEHSLGMIGAGIVSLIAGGLIGLVPAFIAACLVAAWPVIRVFWWWMPELAVTGALVMGWIELAAHADMIVRLAALAAFFAIPAAIGPVRRWLISWSWCLISRHRIRTCFSEFIVANRTGSLPLILAARPTPAGERLWAFLRPGMSLEMIQAGSDKIAVACWASSVTAENPNSSNSALVRFDIKRRDPLTGTIASPLTTLFGSIKTARKADAPAPVALDLTDVTEADVTPAAKTRNAPVARPQWPNSPGASGDTLVGKVVTAEKTEDLDDWI
jgi:hypothetical protein